MPELGEPVHPILQELEPFERRQAQGPPDQGEVDAVGRLLRNELGRRLRSAGRVRLGHGAITIPSRGVPMGDRRSDRSTSSSLAVDERLVATEVVKVAKLAEIRSAWRTRRPFS